MIEERILDFLDGRLGNADEEELLHTLAISPERRGLLREHMQLRELSQTLSRSSELTVPCATTAGLFTRLQEQGFTGPVPVPVTPLQPILPTLPVAAVATGGFLSEFRFASFAAGVIIALLAGFSLSLFQLPGQSSTVSPSHTLSNSTQNQSSQLSNDRVNLAATDQNASMTSMAGASNTPMVGGSTAARSSQGHGRISNNLRRARLVLPTSTTESLRQPSDVTSTPEPENRVQLPSELPIITNAKTWAVREHEMIEPMSANAISRPVAFYQPNETEAESTLPIAFSMRTGAGPVPGGSSQFVNSLSEATIKWLPTSWFVASASIGMLSAHELMASDLGPDPATGVRSIGTQRVLTFTPIGSLSLGTTARILGMQLELMGGVGADAGGVIYPRASLFADIALTHTLSMNLGFEAMTYQHDITNSFVVKQQSLAGTNVAVGDHASSERGGFIGPSIEFSWHP